MLRLFWFRLCGVHPICLAAIVCNYRNLCRIILAERILGLYSSHLFEANVHSIPPSRLWIIDDS